MQKILSALKSVLKFLAYYISKSLFHTFFFAYNRHTWKGKKNIPPSGKRGIILASNHVSNIDPPLAGLPLHRKIHFLAKRSLFKGFLGNWTKAVEAIPVDRGAVSMATIKTIISYLKKGKTVVIFPEGTRSDDGKLKEFQSGIGMIAKKSNAIVVPTYVKGTFKVLKKGAKFPKPYKVTTYYGEPIDYSDLDDKKGAEVYEIISKRVYEGIKKLEDIAYKKTPDKN